MLTGLMFRWRLQRCWRSLKIFSNQKLMPASCQQANRQSSFFTHKKYNMNLHNILSEIGKADPEVYERLDARRSVIKRFATIGGRVALTAVPLALGSMFKSAYGQTNTATLEDVLQYALT